MVGIVAKKKSANDSLGKKVVGKANKSARPKKASKAISANDETVAACADQVKRERDPTKDQQVKRYIKRKASHFTEAQIKTMRNKQNVSISEYIAAGLRVKNCKQGRLSSSFSVSLYGSFDLRSNAFDELSDPGSADTDEELFAFLGQCHDENPGEKNLKALKVHLTRCPRMNEKNFYGLLNGVLEGHLLTCDRALSLQAFMLSYIARTKANETFPRYWSIVKGQLDEALKYSWEKAAKAGVKPESLLLTKRAEISLYIDEDCVDRLVRCRKYSDVPYDVKTMVTRGSKIGESMFKEPWLACAKMIYDAEIRKRLSDLEHNGFAEAEEEAFHRIADARAS
eukprot:TRINITY_DN22191_c0_g1_i1.p1 TRINITY_DN22191_c0_g1~~TRINITY_DN22191_c0_g1_i1.p1  ORF type:complete len:340 (-),score=58.81 TRINITY_DN22191_c0_g1_i1:1157-2176(-)